MEHYSDNADVWAYGGGGFWALCDQGCDYLLGVMHMTQLSHSR